MTFFFLLVLLNHGRERGEGRPAGRARATLAAAAAREDGGYTGGGGGERGRGEGREREVVREWETEKQRNPRCNIGGGLTRGDDLAGAEYNFDD
jgi:hypothetical protein